MPLVLSKQKKKAGVYAYLIRAIADFILENCNVACWFVEVINLKLLGSVDVNKYGLDISVVVSN